MKCHHPSMEVAPMRRMPDPSLSRRSGPPIVHPLLSDGDAEPDLVLTVDDRKAVLVELRLGAADDPDTVRTRFQRLFDEVFPRRTRTRPPDPVQVARHYMKCLLSSAEINALVAADRGAAERLIYRVWPDFIIQAQIDQSVTTVKVDAAVRTYACGGAGIVWGVIDSGIDGDHPHFGRGTARQTVHDPAVLSLHQDFTAMLGAGPQGMATSSPDPLADALGHGTHVAGIIAGQAPDDSATVRIAVNEPDDIEGLPRWTSRPLESGRHLAGMAADALLVSLKVIDDTGQTLSSAVIAAIDYVRKVNAEGRNLRIHGVNLSLGCDWLPSEYGAGQSPLCREIDLLVGTGVVAVISAGNSGAGGTQTGFSHDVHGVLSTITDPGNAAGAITVGSVHRTKPHTYGVTYNSSKGPTLDGRLKPDLVAPGARITSAATGAMAAGNPVFVGGTFADYIEDSGTSMAAAHVSGAVAAFLSARGEFIGQPQRVKQIFLDTATDLGRHVFYQGAGLLNLMAALTEN